MCGGTYRFQAQYLRKIRVPDPTAVSDEAQEALRSAFRARDRAAASAAAWPLYGVDPDTRLPTSRTELSTPSGGSRCPGGSFDGSLGTPGRRVTLEGPYNSLRARSIPHPPLAKLGPW